MEVKINFTPETRDLFKKGKNDIFAVIKYSMFEEIEGEFNKADYPQDEVRMLEATKFDLGTGDMGVYYSANYEYPYGKIDIKLMYEVMGKA